MSPFLDMSRNLSFMCAVLVLMACQPPVTSLKHKNMICDQISQCLCQFATGVGVNLTKLGTETLIFNDTQHGAVFYFNPCMDAQSPCPTGSSMCVFEEMGNKTTDLGGLSHPVQFSSQGIDNPIFLNYDNGDLKTEILLECWSKNETSFIPNNRSDRYEPDDEVKFHFLIQSPEACLQPSDYYRSNAVSDGLSNGALFFIVLLVLWCSYVLVGAAANHFLRGATGFEMIPHYEFWRTVPTSFMNGVKYIFNGCRSPPSYEQI